MTYYNRSGKKLKLKLDDMEYLKSGCFAKILHNSNIAFKQYFPGSLHCCRMSTKLFDVLKDIKNPNFIALYDIYSCASFLEVIKSRIKMQSFIVDGYTAKYYPDDSVNILYEHKDYILDNFRELELLFDIFTENNILVHDLNRANSILSKDGIVLVDPDFFEIDPNLGLENPKIYISTENKRSLLCLYKSIIVDAASGHQQYNRLLKFICDELFYIDITEKTDVTHEISKVLKYVKKLLM